MNIRIQKRKDDGYDFRILGENGEVILFSEAYSTETSAIRDIGNFIKALPNLYEKYNINSNGPLRENKHFEIRKDI
jgi:uncharacterized protein YegP (UPF0339 family)